MRWTIRVGLGSTERGAMSWDEIAITAPMDYDQARDLAKRAADTAIEYVVKNLKRCESRTLLAGAGKEIAFSVRVVRRPAGDLYALDEVIDEWAGPWREWVDDVGIAVTIGRAAALAALDVVIGAQGAAAQAS